MSWVREKTRAILYAIFDWATAGGQAAARKRKRRATIGRSIVHCVRKLDDAKKTPEQIAAELGLSLSSVNRILRRLHARPSFADREFTKDQALQLLNSRLRRKNAKVKLSDIYSVLDDNNFKISKEIAEALDINLSHASSALSILYRQGFIERNQIKKNGSGGRNFGYRTRVRRDVFI